MVWVCLCLLFNIQESLSVNLYSMRRSGDRHEKKDAGGLKISDDRDVVVYLYLYLYLCLYFYLWFHEKIISRQTWESGRVSVTKIQDDGDAVSCGWGRLCQENGFVGSANWKNIVQHHTIIFHENCITNISVNWYIQPAMHVLCCYIFTILSSELPQYDRPWTWTWIYCTKQKKECLPPCTVTGLQYMYLVWLYVP